MDSPEEWGAVAVEDGPEAWGAKPVDENPEAWGAKPVEDKRPRTEGSQLAVKIPEVMEDWGLDFPKEMPGVSASDAEAINAVKRSKVIQEATRRVNESPVRGVARGAQRFAIGAAEAMRDPANMALMGITPIVPPVGAGVMMGLAAKAVGSGSGQLSVPGGASNQEATEQMLNMALMAGGARGSLELLRPPSPRPSPTEPVWPPGEGGSGVLSEFGGEADLPPPSGQPGAANAVPGANGEPIPTPEAPKTLESQLAWLKEGKRQAVLVTPGASVPDLTASGMETHPTSLGTFIYNPETVNPAIIDAHVAGNTVGDLLGYGISDKPADASAVVTVRDGQGIEKQAVVTDQASLPKVLEAAKGVADKSDTVQVEAPEKVIEDRQQRAPEWAISELRNRGWNTDWPFVPADLHNPDFVELIKIDPSVSDAVKKQILSFAPRGQNEIRLKPAVEDRQQSAILNKVLNESIYARQPVPEKLAQQYEAANGRPIGWPEGYKLEGENFVYTEPERKLTPQEQMVRENQEAMRKLSEAKQAAAPAEETALTTEAQRHREPRTAEPTPEEMEPNWDVGPVERPPDILDWINDNHPEGVRFGKAEFADYVRQYKERLKELKPKQRELIRTQMHNDFLRSTSGSGADEVLDAMHRDGIYRRIESEDDLADAMLRAMEQRIAGAKAGAQDLTGKFLADPIEGWLSKAIEATNADPAKQLEGVTGAPVWLAKGAANAVLRVTKAVYTTTRDLAKAIAAGIEHLRSLKIDGFDEGQARQWLEGSLGERETGQKILASDAISDEAKAAITEYLYQRRTNATDQQLADGMVRDLGVDAAVKIFRNPPSEFPGAVQSKLLGSIIRTLAEQERRARSAGDTTAADTLAQRQAGIADEGLRRATELGQSLQAMDDIVDLSPAAQVARLKNTLDRQANDALEVRRDQVDLARRAIEEGRDAGIEQLKQDPAVNAAAKAAVNQAIEQSPDIQKAVVMEMAEPWASSSEVMKAAREQVRLKANELLNKGPRPPQLSPSQHLHALLDDLAKRAATIFAGHLQGAEPHLTIVDKLMQRLGLERSRAVSLSEALSKEWDRQLKAAQAAIPKRIAMQRVARERAAAGGLPEGAPDRLVDAAIRKQLRDHNVKLGDVLKQETERQDATGQHVAERIVQTSGLTGEMADTLRTTLTNRWNAIVTRAQVAKLEALQKNTGVTLSGPMKSAFQKLTELERLGALTSEKFFDVVKQSLKLKQLTAEDAAKLRELVQKAQAEKEGSHLREVAAAEVLKFTEHLKGNVSLRDVPMAVFYSSIVSGLTTYVKVPLENASSLAFHAALAFLAHPIRNALHPLDFASDIGGAVFRGAKAGAVQMADIMRTGVASGIKSEMVARPSVLEMKPYGERLEALNFHKYFQRLISAVHVPTFAPAWEVKSAVIARDVATREGLTGAAGRQRVADLMANTDAKVAQARAQAIQELPDGGRLDIARRTRENLLSMREEDMPGITETSRDYAQRITYLNEPYGPLGDVASGVGNMLERLRNRFPILGTAAKTQIPFTKIVANILNEKLNWTPLGLFHALDSYKTGELYGKPMKPGDRAELYTKVALGTIGLGVAYMYRQHVHGNGPASPEHRKQLQATGWIPHSWELDGKHVSFMNTPLAGDMALIGNLEDWHRYSKGDQADAITRTAFTLKTIGDTIVSQGMLDSVKGFMEVFGDENSATGADKLAKLGARVASSFLFPNMVQQVDRIWDPTVYDKTGMEALVKGQIPFVRRENKPALTVLGDKIESGPFHYWASKVSDDRLLRTLAEKQAWVPEPSRNQNVGDKDRFRALTPDQFYDLVRNSGHAIRRELTANLAELRSLPPKEAQKYVQKVAQEQRREALERYK